MTDVPFSVVKRDDLAPRCAHCEAELSEVYMKARGDGLFGSRHVVYFCPHCLKVLGFGQSRMIQ